jgi:hypothetical protein
MGSLAHIDLARVKGIAVSGDQSAHDGVLGLVGLKIADAAGLLATGAADDLMQELESALGGARIPIRQAEVGIDNADEFKLGKMVTFGDKLRANDDVEATLGNLVQFLAQPLD